MAKESNVTVLDKTTAPPAPPRKEIIAPLNALTLLEQSNMLWRLVARDATAEDLLQPNFWSVIQSKIKSFDRIAVVTSTHYFDLVCLYCEAGCPVRMHVLHQVEIPVVAEPEHGRVPPGYLIDFDPATQRYTGMRARDRHPMTAPRVRWNEAYSELLAHAVFRDIAPNAR